MIRHSNLVLPAAFAAEIFLEMEMHLEFLFVAKSDVRTKRLLTEKYGEHV